MSSRTANAKPQIVMTSPFLVALTSCKQNPLPGELGYAAERQVVKVRFGVCVWPRLEVVSKDGRATNRQASLGDAEQERPHLVHVARLGSARAGTAEQAQVERLEDQHLDLVGD